MDTFIKFIKNQGNLWKLGAVFALGILLLSFSGLSGKKSEIKDIEGTDRAELEELCSSVFGVGECRVYVTFTEEEKGFRKEGKKVDGIVVICEGGNSPTVRKTLTEMLSSLYGIGTNRVSVGYLQK